MEPNLPAAVIKQLYCQKMPSKHLNITQGLRSYVNVQMMEGSDWTRVPVTRHGSSLPWEPRMTTSQRSVRVLCDSPPLEPCTLWFHRRNRLFCRGQLPPYSNQNLEWRQGEWGGNRTHPIQKSRTVWCWIRPVILMCPSSSRRILSGERNSNGV